MTCQHPQTVLLRLDCHAGGVQFRHYCLTCWTAGAALPHKDVDKPDDVTQADPELIELARESYARANLRWTDV